MTFGRTVQILCCVIAGVTFGAPSPDAPPKETHALAVGRPAKATKPGNQEPFGTYDQCVAYPVPAAFHWSRETIEAFCADEFTPALQYSESSKLIEAGKGKELDARLAKILDDYLAGKLPEGTARYAYENFSRADNATGAVIERWLVQSPGSAHALAARGIHHLQIGAEARGTAFIKDTPPEKLAVMTHELALAERDLMKAVASEPRILHAHASLISIAKLNGDDELGARALANALRIDPKNFYVRAAYQFMHQPRWGGSIEAMDKIASDAAPWLGKNPRLVNLRALALAHRGFESFANKDVAASLRLYEVGLAEGPIGYDLYTAGTMAAKLDRPQYAIELYDQALRFSPRYVDVRRHRARAHIKLKMYEQAQTDLDVVLEVVPDDAWSLSQYAFLLLERKDYVHALEKLERANKANPSDAWVTERLASEYLYRTRNFRKAEPLVAQLLAKNPKSGAAWLMRADLIQNQGGPGLREAAENFVRYADTSVDAQRTALPKVKAWLASHPHG